MNLGGKHGTHSIHAAPLQQLFNWRLTTLSRDLTPKDSAHQTHLKHSDAHAEYNSGHPHTSFEIA
jgi:hypothetical protein